METELINASHNFKPEKITQFRDGQSEDCIVTLYIVGSDDIYEKPLRDLRLFFTDPDIEAKVVNDSTELIFSTSDKMLKMLGIDYKWAIEPVRGKKYGRLGRLLGENVETVKTDEDKPKAEKKPRSTATFSVAIGMQNGKGIVENIRTFSGKEKECVAFLNKEYSQDQLRSFFTANNVFAFVKEGEEPEWKTKQQLVEEGVFEL